MALQPPPASRQSRNVAIAGSAGVIAATVGGVLLVHTANAVIAAATAAQAAAVVGALWFARRQLAEAAAARKDQARAYVVVYLDVPAETRQFPNIVVANLGTTAAYDVRMTFVPPLRSSMDQRGGMQLADVGMLKDGIPTLAPSMKLATVFDYMTERPNEWEQSHHVSVTYRDRDGEEHRDEFVIDLATYRTATWIDRKGLHQLNEEVKGLREELHNMRTGWGGPMLVLTEDRSTYAERRDAEREEMIARHRQFEQQRLDRAAAAEAEAKPEDD